MIIDLDTQRMQAMASKDIATLNKLLADDLIYCSFLGAARHQAEPDRRDAVRRVRSIPVSNRPT